MSNILRVVKNGNYSVVSNEPFNDPGLSWKAKGLLAYLLTKPDNWQVNVEQLRKASSNGRDSIYTALKELIAARYIVRVQKRKEKGRTGGYDYIISETKIPLMELPFTENPETEKPHINNNCTEVITDSTNDLGAKKPKNEGIEKMKREFLNQVIRFVKQNPNKYPKKFYVEFCTYWLEEDLKKRNMRFQGEKYFNLGRRLATWHKGAKEEEIKNHWAIEKNTPKLVDLLAELLN